jgi:pSer/pThr/pTyr-binding forkhead associated (FHA) protein
VIRLRYLGHNLEVPEGQFVIGRSSKCQLSIDDPLISRQHAVLTVQNGVAHVEDLGSRNGVLVNGKRITGTAAIAEGDTITVGSQAMTVHGLGSTGSVTPRAPHRVEMQTMQTGLMDLADDPTDDTMIRSGPLKGAPDKRVNELTLVGAVAEKALAMGRAEDAQRLLERPLLDLLKRVKGGGLGIDDQVVQRAASLAVKLAMALNKGDWVDYTFELYTVRHEILPQAIVDELYTVLRKVRCDGSKLEIYLEELQATSVMGPNERFQMSRIEGLEPLVGLK